MRPEQPGAEHEWRWPWPAAASDCDGDSGRKRGTLFDGLRTPRRRSQKRSHGQALWTWPGRPQRGPRPTQQVYLEYLDGDCGVRRPGGGAVAGTDMGTAGRGGEGRGPARGEASSAPAGAPDSSASS